MDPVIIAALIGGLVGGLLGILASMITLIPYFEARREKKLLEKMQKQKDSEGTQYMQLETGTRLESSISNLEKEVQSLTRSVERLGIRYQQLCLKSWWQFWR